MVSSEVQNTAASAKDTKDKTQTEQRELVETLRFARYQLIDDARSLARSHRVCGTINEWDEPEAEAEYKSLTLHALRLGRFIEDLGMGRRAYTCAGVCLASNAGR